MRTNEGCLKIAGHLKAVSGWTELLSVVLDIDIMDTKARVSRI